MEQTFAQGGQKGNGMSETVQAGLSPERVDAKFSTNGENTRQDASREMVGSNPACDPLRREAAPSKTF